MWILPKQLTQSNGSLATVETISDLNECSRICASSLLARSKSSQSKTFLRRWKQDTWRRLPYGRIAKPSLGNHLLIERIFSSRPILASHLAQPVNGKAPMTSGTYGHTFTDGYYAPDLFSSSLRTSKDTYRWDSPQSSAIWKKEVTKRRGEYSARLKSGHPMSVKGSSSLQLWVTPNSRDWKDTFGQTAMRKDQKTRIDQLPRQIFAIGGGLYSQTNVDSARTAMRLFARAAKHTTQNAPAQDQLRTGSSSLSAEKRFTEGQKPDGPITQQSSKRQSSRPEPLPRVNMNWVEMLMGLPIGWTEPDCLATELSQPRQSAPSASFLAS